MYELNKTSRQVATLVAGMIAFLLLLGISGRCDYNEQVIYSMSYEAYNQIVEKVGTDDSDIVDEYMVHRSYYDSLQ